ncbi:MAG: mechanosensitive ion channel domain-containing protein [Aminobacterium sp.]|jgi:small conductance mechanosensitive channel|nr:mechanosensitive ion channel [Aminobacterium sp.]MDD3426428.1 mechanosensitive ion channel [Aminobacterium sp.]MDD3708139.1 mechanosensitive ion channel [Aminobacterium sp.]MDD4229015.1 mechanosensitive ion channel [Aminobacterium sp.]MDD4551658.1 mechanosensitive ion channel [Aminobacterium sp.]
MNNIIYLVMPIIKNIILALLTVLVGLKVIQWITKGAEKFVEKSSFDKTLKPFVVSLINALLKVLLVISVISILGIDTTSFVAVIAAAGFAVGLAFKGSLSNFAGGVLLLALRPFKVGDYIEASGFSGTVQAIQILYTELVSVDNKVIFIPNGSLSNSSIVNYSIKDTRRVDFKFGVGYESDTSMVKEVLKAVVGSHPLVLNDPEPFVRMSEHGDSAIVFAVRVWVKAQDYWTVYFDVVETVKKRFDEEGISIPYPQMDVHLKQQ